MKLNFYKSWALGHSQCQLSIFIGFFVLLTACSETPASGNGSDDPSVAPSTAVETATNNTPPYAFLFDPNLADGFDFPIGNPSGKGAYTDLQTGKTHQGWYIATHTGEQYALGIHTGEDWNGAGGGDTDLGQPVHAIARGEVLAVKDYGAPWGNIIMIRHVYLENAQVDTVFSVYAHLAEVQVAVGQVVQKRDTIGTIGSGGGVYPAHLHLEIRRNSMATFPVDYWPSTDGKDVPWVMEHYLEPKPFIESHRAIAMPQEETQLLVAIKQDYQMYFFEAGQLKATYVIALSQDPDGHKQRQGDNRLPEGDYNIIQKSRGPFNGPVADYFGVAWMRINYPNTYDAKAALAKGVITKTQAQQIEKAIANKQEPPKNTAIGGGIGIHGWAGDWTANGAQNLTWGCISMHNADLDTLYNKIELQTRIMILP